MADELKTLTNEEIDAANEAQAELEANIEVTLIESVTEVKEVVVPSDLKVSIVNVAAPKEVVFTPLTGSEDRADINTYNQTAQSLRDSINLELTLLVKAFKIV